MVCHILLFFPLLNTSVTNPVLPNSYCIDFRDIYLPFQITVTLFRHCISNEPRQPSRSETGSSAYCPKVGVNVAEHRTY